MANIETAATKIANIETTTTKMANVRKVVEQI
jgi:hypothetical protein